MDQSFLPVRDSLFINRKGSAGKTKGFTLVELITVMAIMLIIAGISIPAIATFMQSMNLGQAGQIVANQIGLAEQMAGSRGCTVEVRMLQSPASASGNPYYFAIQLFAVTSGGAPVPMNRAMLLPAGSVVWADTTTQKYSPYLSTVAAMQTPTPTMVMGGTTYNYVSFRISPGGLVTPYSTFPTLYFTVVPTTWAVQGGTKPLNNFVTVQINPATATQLVYRP